MAVARRKEDKDKEKRKKRPIVHSRHGSFRFQTGMVTADLLNRGLEMNDALGIARDVRDRIAGRGEIASEQLRAIVLELIKTRLGDEAAQRYRRRREVEQPLLPMIESSRGRVPFSRGAILSQLGTVGLELDVAFDLALRLEAWIQEQPESILLEEALTREVNRLLLEFHGPDYARRYRLIDWVRRSETPVVILIGGATGTGKSTLAMELAAALGVVWVTGTDTVRETMRTVLSPDLLPGLHDHSFRGMVQGGQVLSDPRERVLAGFQQQAAQVAVGVRAVIRRALRENSHIIIEGTHIAPPFWQYVPSETKAAVAGFILAVPDEKEHRSRFPQRSKQQVDRPADTYLDALQSVRWIHDDLLRLAEDAEAVVLKNVNRRQTLTSAVDFLSRELPIEDPESLAPRPSVAPPANAIPTLFLILDGLADEPNPVLDGRTPLAAARTPTLRRLAASGGQGRVHTARSTDLTPSTDEGIMALLGARVDAGKFGRGMFEALGLGIPIHPDAVLFRGNLATVGNDGAILDRRAGRIRDGVQDLLAELGNIPLSGGITGRIYPTHEHRVLVMLLGSGLSDQVSDTDPGGTHAVERVHSPRPLDKSPEAARTAQALRELLAIAAQKLARHPVSQGRLARGLPPVNAILTRGAARPPATRAEHRWVGAMVAGCNTALGVARYVGLKTARSISMTGSLDTDLAAKFRSAGELLEDNDFVVVHIKGTDVAAHDRRPLEKRDFIERIDRALGEFLQSHPALSGKLRVVVSADHGTSSITGDHLPDPVPLLLATWQADVEDEEDFDENSTSDGALGLLESGDLAELLGLVPKENLSEARHGAVEAPAVDAGSPSRAAVLA
ncbi:MAG TPA: alkaline phosphatase family protein [Polyangiaceae bacterium]